RGVDIEEVARQLDCDTKTRRERGLELARKGDIRILVADRDLATVPEPWSKYARPFSRYGDEAKCRVLVTPPAYLVQGYERSQSLSQQTPANEKAPEPKNIWYTAFIPHELTATHIKGKTHLSFDDQQIAVQYCDKHKEFALYPYPLAEKPQD